MKFICMVCILALPIFSSGQGKTPFGVNAEENLKALGGAPPGGNLVQLFNNRYEGVRGTPFLFEHWQQAQLILASGEPALTLIRLDICADELWVILTSWIPSL